MSADSSADNPIEPTPTIAAAFSGMRPRANASDTKPASGKAKTNGSRSIMAGSPVHLRRVVHVEILEAAEDLQQQREPDARFSRGEREDEDEHDLAVGLLPARAGQQQPMLHRYSVLSDHSC